MKSLDFAPFKSDRDFKKNYKLHDLAEEVGKNLLTQWGVDFRTFGEDNRFRKVWEKGEDKPDLIISFGKNSAFLDWKGKHKDKFIVNKRAADAYLAWSRKFNIPVIVVFFVFDEKNKLTDRRFAVLKENGFVPSKEVAWDKNVTVEFTGSLERFEKSSLLKVLM